MQYRISDSYMGKTMKKSFLFFFAVVLLGCNTDEILNPDKIDISELEKDWVHSREEETDSIQIYRPINFKEFPASRYREVYSFSDSGRCRYLVLAPNDAHYFKNGTWTYSENDQKIIIFNSAAQAIIEFKIISVTMDLLKIIQKSDLN